MTDAAIEIQGEQLHLLPERAIYWERTKTLFVADVHLGKAATFRAHRIPMPEGSMSADLARLTKAIERTQVNKLIILGDLFHAAKGRDEHTHDLFGAWRNQHANLELILVRGNHDHKAGDPLEKWNIRCVDGPTAGPHFVLSHSPIEPTEGYALAGHLHPAVQLEGQAHQTIKLPCFWFTKHCGILPAFGSFIDHAIVRPEVGDKIFVVTENQVLAVA
ncbi:MAG: ligase-associated DNA damage response endonuclease PdeM [Chloroflexota bacterium]